MLDDFAKALEMEEKMFEKVKQYLEDHPNEALESVADHTDVRDKLILKWIDQGRIQLGGSSNKADSRAQLAEEFKKAQQGMKSGNTSRFDNASKRSMHITDKKR